MLEQDGKNKPLRSATSRQKKKKTGDECIICVISSKSDMNEVRLLLVKKINEIIAVAGLSQRAAASILQIDQPKISQMKNNKISGFSVERLFKFFVRLGWKIKLTVDNM